MKISNHDTLVIASHNKGKIKEIRELLSEFSLTVKSIDELGLPEPEETGATFTENALIKARAAMAATGLPSLADDSGLVVFALNGEPGIYSARWAGPSKDFKAAFARLEKELTATGATDYSAKFVCALALITPDGKEEVVEGEVHGSLVFPPRGEYGFGYDPIFVANGLTKTYGEIEAKVKDTINHRADAFKKLKQLLK